MKKPQKTPHAFQSQPHEPGAPMLRSDKQPPQMLAAVAEHVLGHRVTKIEFTRELDEQASDELGYPVDNIDLLICLDNNVAYCARLVVKALAVVSRGEALAHIEAGDPDYTQPQ